MSPRRYLETQRYSNPKLSNLFQLTPCRCSFSTSLTIPCFNLFSRRVWILLFNSSFDVLMQILMNSYGEFFFSNGLKLGTGAPVAKTISSALTSRTLLFLSIVAALAGSKPESILNNSSVVLYWILFLISGFGETLGISQS